MNFWVHTLVISPCLFRQLQLLFSPDASTALATSAELAALRPAWWRSTQADVPRSHHYDDRSPITSDNWVVEAWGQSKFICYTSRGGGHRVLASSGQWAYGCVVFSLYYCRDWTETKLSNFNRSVVTSVPLCMIFLLKWPLYHCRQYSDSKGVAALITSCVAGSLTKISRRGQPRKKWVKISCKWRKISHGQTDRHTYIRTCPFIHTDDDVDDCKWSSQSDSLWPDTFLLSCLKVEWNSSRRGIQKVYMQVVKLVHQTNYKSFTYF